jgi:hypothetical protein
MYYTLNPGALADVADLAHTLAMPLPARENGCC